MKITVTTNHIVELTNTQQRDIAIEYLESTFGKDNKVSTVNGKSQVVSWYDTGHGSGLTQVIREASETDIAMFHTIKALKSIQV